MSDLTPTGYDMERLATLAFLSTVPLFAGVREAELAELAGLLRQRNLAAGEVLWHEGGPAVGMVLIVDGRISTVAAATWRPHDRVHKPRPG